MKSIDSGLVALAGLVELALPLRVDYAGARAAARFQGAPPGNEETARRLAADAREHGEAARVAIRALLECDEVDPAVVEARAYHLRALGETADAWPELAAAIHEARRDRWVETPEGLALRRLVAEAAYLEASSGGLEAGVSGAVERALDCLGTAKGLDGALREELERLEVEKASDPAWVLLRRAAQGEVSAAMELESIRQDWIYRDEIARERRKGS